MFKKIGIFYFSGTGNTECIAHLIKKEFDKNAKTDLFKVEDYLKHGNNIDINNYDLIGIGHPAHGFDAPIIMYKFIKALKSSKGEKVFFFKTAAADVYINYSLSTSLIKILSKKGYDVFYDRIICMGSNWLVKYPEEFVKILYLTALNKVKHMCEEINKGCVRRYKVNFILKIFTKFISIGEKIFAKFFGKMLYAGKKCNKCLLCVNKCPVQNIILKRDKIKFNSHCMSCMKCIYNCPKNTIKAHLFNFLILKDGYNIKGIINNNKLNTEFENKKMTKIKKYFSKYLNNLEN